MRLDLYRVIELFRKSFSNSLSDREKEELDDIFQNDYLDEVYDQLSDDRFIEMKFREFDGYEYKPAFEKLIRYHRRSIVRKWIAWSTSVAAVIIFVLLFVYSNFQSTNNQCTPLAFQERIILPGSKSAVLKLADGRVVTMGEQPLEIVTDKGGVVKYDKGQLSYSSEEPFAEELFNELEVPRGGECQVLLDDGTKVWLNADSRLKYPIVFNGVERKVILSGEAYFEVKKNARPFIVSTDAGDIIVLGTAFGIRAYPEEVDYTTLVSGKVSFQSKNNQKIILSPGEQIVVHASGEVEKREVNVEEYIGWKSGLFVFKNKTLETIMNMFERWYNVEVIFQNDELRSLKFTGDLERYDSINTFLHLLERLNEMKYEIKGNTILLFK